MRINKYLARCGLGSRRSVEELIKQGTVRVNGAICTDLATTINVEKDIVTVNNKRAKPIAEKLYILLHKPKGYIVSRQDEYDRKTVYHLIPPEWSHLFPVGRLDKDSEGLLLMTNDGSFAQKILHPKFSLAKIYRVSIKEPVHQEHLDILRKGIEIDGKRTLPAKISVKNRAENDTILRVTINEGKNRQIRKMFERFGYTITSLKRLQVGSIKLDNVPCGMFRLLKPSEVTKVLSLKSVPLPRNAYFKDSKKYK